jgi:hypothetical protein
LAELVAFAECAKLEFAQGQSTVGPEKECMAVPLLNLVVADSRAGLDRHTAGPEHTHTVAKNVELGDQYENETQEEVESVDQLVLQ